MVNYVCLYSHYSPFPENHHVRPLMSTQLRTFSVRFSNHPFKKKTVTVKMGIFLNFCLVEHKYIYIYIYLYNDMHYSKTNCETATILPSKISVGSVKNSTLPDK